MSICGNGLLGLVDTFARGGVNYRITSLLIPDFACEFRLPNMLEHDGSRQPLVPEQFASLANGTYDGQDRFLGVRFISQDGKEDVLAGVHRFHAPGLMSKHRIQANALNADELGEVLMNPVSRGLEAIDTWLAHQLLPNTNSGHNLKRKQLREINKLFAQTEPQNSLVELLSRFAAAEQCMFHQNQGEQVSLASMRSWFGIPETPEVAHFNLLAIDGTLNLRAFTSEDIQKLIFYIGRQTDNPEGCIIEFRRFVTSVIPEPDVFLRFINTYMNSPGLMIKFLNNLLAPNVVSSWDQDIREGEGISDENRFRSIKAAHRGIREKFPERTLVVKAESHVLPLSNGDVYLSIAGVLVNASSGTSLVSIPFVSIDPNAAKLRALMNLATQIDESRGRG